MTAPEVSNENDWCLVEWTDFTRTVVHSSEVVDLEGQISGSTVFIKNGDDLLRSSLVERNADREHLERQISAKAKGRPQRQTKAPAIVDIIDENADPFDFEPSATDWAPSDEDLSDSEFEVENKRRKISLSNTNCRKRQCKLTKNELPSSSTPNNNVLTPSNKLNNVPTPSNQMNSGGRRRNARKQAAPKQFISPPKEEPIYVPLPRKPIIVNGRRVHILPNSTRPVVPNNTMQGTPNFTKQIAPNCTKQIASNCTKQITPNGRKNNNQALPINKKEVPTNGKKNNLRKRKFPATKTNAAKRNATRTNTRTPTVTKAKRPTPKANKTNTPTQNVAKTNTPKDNATTSNVIKAEQNETIKPAEENMSAEKPATNNEMPNTLDKPTETNPENAHVGPTAETKNVVNEHVTENGGNILDNDKRKNDKVEKQPKMINIIIDVKTYSKFRRAFREIHNTYDTALKVIPMKKEKKSKLRKLKQFYKAKRVVATNNNQKVSVIKKKKETPKQKKVAKSFNVSPNVSTQGVCAENYSDENEVNENVDDFDRSDDNILISNKFENINTAKEPKTNDEKLVAIGSGKTLIPKDKFRKIKWNSYTVATRGLLLAAFPRRVLATHSMTGKRSPAFLNKPAKMCLDPKKVADIIIEVMDRFKIRENLIRSVITTKCADESKMFKMRMQKKEREAKAKEQNTKNKPTVAV